MGKAMTVVFTALTLILGTTVGLAVHKVSEARAQAVKQLIEEMK